MKKTAFIILIFLASLGISLGLARLTMGFGDDRIVLELQRSDRHDRPADPRPSARHTFDAPLYRSCNNGYRWACRVLDEQREKQRGDDARDLSHWCARGGACSCVRLAAWYDGHHAHARAVRAFEDGCAAGSGYACAHAGARLLPDDEERAEKMLVRACELEPAADGCRFLGQYLEKRGRAGARVVLERGCSTGDGRACLALVKLGSDDTGLEEVAERMLFETCHQNRVTVGLNCGSASESIRYAACGELANLRIEDGAAGEADARALVRAVVRECDTRDDRTCALDEFLPRQLLQRAEWVHWCAEGDEVACRVVEDGRLTGRPAGNL